MPCLSWPPSCVTQCLNCQAAGHNAYSFPTACPTCHVAGNHIYRYCETDRREAQQQLVLPRPPVAPSPPAAPVPPALSMNSLIVATQASTSTTELFHTANDHRGQICFRRYKIGGQL